MKKIITILVLTAFISCKKTANKKAEKTIAPVTAEMMETAIIYEANIRQYSKEGTFEQFTKDIPQLKQLGVNIIWLMPIFPISETKRKATGNQFASDIEDPEERKKYLGSYYAISDYTKINPEFGTIDDFRTLLQTAHEHDIYVILDWVPNHTGWDHWWLKEHPEFYTKNADGDITDPLNADGTPVGWADVADLNYDNRELRKAMISDMLYWVTEENVDGFRCDVAGSVPTDFWEEAVPQLRAKKDLFILAEAWEPELLKGNLFDMAYGWDTHHKMNDIAQGKGNVKTWNQRMDDITRMYEQDDILMNFVTNHDENSWNGTIKERMGDASELFTALSYTAPGMPLIYSGQEYDLNHRLKFFEKDSIPKEKGATWALLEKLGALKTSTPALNGGKNAASYEPVDTQNDHVLIFKRRKVNSELVFVANMSGEVQEINNVISGNYQDYMKNTSVALTEDTLVLQPWEYRILLNP